MTSMKTYPNLYYYSLYVSDVVARAYQRVTRARSTGTKAEVWTS